MIIENLGSTERYKETMRLLTLADGNGEIPKKINRIFLLPIPTSKDSVHLTGTDRLTREIFDCVGEGDFLAGYDIKNEDKKKMRRLGALVYDAADDERFLSLNCSATAIGALGYVLSTNKKLPEDTRVAIIGYGRIGRELTRLLLFLGAQIKIYTGNKMQCIELCECGVDTHLVKWSQPLPLYDFDLIINTAPTDLSASFPEKKIPSGMRVIELASGNNFGDIDGIERLPGIPDKYFPKSSGRIYYECIMKYLGGGL